MVYINVLSAKKARLDLWGLGSIFYIQSVQSRGQDGTLQHTSLYVSRREQCPSTITLNFLLERNELMGLIKRDENCNLGSLYSKPGSNVVSKAFSMSKKTQPWTYCYWSLGSRSP